jgi:hypothetical protein
MNRPIVFVFVLLVAAACATAPTVSQEHDAVNAVLDDWHRAAADANETRYFDAMAPEFVFLGTDATERWDRGAFRDFAHPYFVKGTAWTFTPRARRVTLSPRGDVAWFDERLDSASYGECRGSGVLRKMQGRWLLTQYNLSIPIPNALAKKFVEEIRGAAPSAKP